MAAGHEDAEDGHELVSAEESQLAEDLARFNNVKNEFLIFGRLASYGLFRQGQLQESINVCSAVLAIDPKDDQMRELKTKIEKFETMPNASQLIKAEILKETTESPIRRLRRSVSEIRKSKPFTFEYENSSSSNNGTINETRNGNGTPGDDNDRAEGRNGNWSPGNAGTPSTKVARSHSENCRRTKSTSILQKIKFYDAGKVERSSFPLTSLRRKASKRPTEDTVVESPAPTPYSSHTQLSSTPSLPLTCQMSIKREPVIPVIVMSTPPEHTSLTRDTMQCTTKTRKASHGDINGNRPANGSIPSDNGESAQIKSCNKKKALSRQFGSVNILERDRLPSSPAEILPATTKMKADSKCSWSDTGIRTFPPDVIAQIESELFNSDLITKACVLSTNGDILGLTIGFRIKQYEIQTLLGGMSDASFLTSSKLTVGGIQYNCLSGTNSVVRARVNKWGINCTKFKAYNITFITLYDHPVLPKPVALLLKKVERFLDESTKNGDEV